MNTITVSQSEFLWIAVAVLVALPVGGLVTSLFFRRLVRRLHLASSLPSGEAVPGWLIGTVERTFFTLAVAYDLSGAAVGMIAWITVKMVSNWNRPDRKAPSDDPEITVQLSMAALLASLVSLTFATIGGLLWRAALT